MTDIERLVISTTSPDPRAAVLLADAHALGLGAVVSIAVADVICIDGVVSEALRDVIVSPLLQVSGNVGQSGDLIVETALRPGVTDGFASEIMRAAAELGTPVRSVRTGKRYSVAGSLQPADVDRLVSRLLSNPVIEQCVVGGDVPFGASSDAVAQPTVDTVAIRGLAADQLAALNVERGLALDPAEFAVIQAHFADLGRDPTDAELETLGQTWSEHCAHKTFRAKITTEDGTVLQPLLAQLRDTTERIAHPMVVSAFVGNAGIVDFGSGLTYALKAETHNHPSAVEPFGGANTGVGGVIRDVMGADHKPIAVTDILCFGPTDLNPDQLPDGVLHPRRIASGVISGVADYGNKIGLPNVAGAVLYDPGYTANPLVFAGCIGTAPSGRAALRGPFPGDRVVVLGGRTGRDGIRGATFSSRTMDATTGEVEGASVQIGDPIIEKLLIDMLDDCQGLFSAITDCGAGGLSSAVGEMAERTGADVDMAVAPLKYPGLAPWEVWLSEAQERMVLAVPPESIAMMQGLATSHGVEMTDLGHFTGDGRLLVRYGALTVVDLDVSFLHDGRPRRELNAVMPQPDRTSDSSRHSDDPAATLLALLAHPNIASKADVIRRYDHEIRGATVVKPLLGVELDAHADGVVLAEPGDTAGIAVGIGVNPWYGALDPEWMARAVVDEAVRNVVAVGADPSHIALLDNFSWGDPRRPSTLGELAACVAGCCEASISFDAPFVSGKDSLNNEYLTADGSRRSVPPTLVITAVAPVPDADRCVTPDLKEVGNVVVLVGPPAFAFGGSHFDMVCASGGLSNVGPIPAPDPTAPARYAGLHLAMRAGLIRSCHDVSEGGLAVALAEMVIGGGLGIRANVGEAAALTGTLFAEGNGRLVCEMTPDALGDLEQFLGEPVAVLGSVTGEAVLAIDGVRPITLGELREAFGVQS